MKAVLKRLHSPDVDLDTYYPEDEENFGFLLEAMIGPKDEPGEESFDFMVCTPDYLKNEYKDMDAVFARAYILVFNYNLKSIKSLIERYCESCSGDNWKEIATKLSRVGNWEFEDYTPYEES